MKLEVCDTVNVEKCETVKEKECSPVKRDQCDNILEDVCKEVIFVLTFSHLTSYIWVDKLLADFLQDVLTSLSKGISVTTSWRRSAERWVAMFIPSILCLPLIFVDLQTSSKIFSHPCQKGPV